MQHAQGNGARVAWEEEGQGDALLLVMGHMFGRQMWHWVVPSLAEEFRVLRYDNRGVGDTESADDGYSVEDLAGDAIAVLDAAGVDKAHVFGVSMGGVIAQEIALSHPERVRSLVLGCTAAFGEGENAKGAWLDTVKYAFPPTWLIGASRRALYASGTPKERVVTDRRLFAQQRTTGAGLRGQAAAVRAYHSLERIREITQPTLVLHGARDRAVPLARGEQIAERIPGAQLTVFADAGHHFIADLPERSSDEVKTFLRSVSATGPKVSKK